MHPADDSCIDDEATTQSSTTAPDTGPALLAAALQTASTPDELRAADRDQDQIPDVDDACPDDPEDLDGEDDEDGCPDLRCRVDPCKIKLLEPVYFAHDKWEIDKRSFPLLNDIAYVLRVNPQITFELGGHTDSKGSAVYNKELSQRRVDNVAAHLLALGVAPRRFVAQGHGEDIPVDTNRTAEGRAHNRRVELHRTDVPDCRP